MKQTRVGRGRLNSPSSTSRGITWLLELKEFEISDVYAWPGTGTCDVILYRYAVRQALEIQRRQRVSTGSNCAAKLCRSEIPLVESRRQLLDLWQMTILVEFMSENSRTSEFLLLRLSYTCLSSPFLTWNNAYEPYTDRKQMWYDLCTFRIFYSFALSFTACLFAFFYSISWTHTTHTQPHTYTKQCNTRRHTHTPSFDETWPGKTRNRQLRHMCLLEWLLLPEVHHIIQYLSAAASASSWSACDLLPPVSSCRADLQRSPPHSADNNRAAWRQHCSSPLMSSPLPHSYFSLSLLLKIDIYPFPLLLLYLHFNVIILPPYIISIPTVSYTPTNSLPNQNTYTLDTHTDAYSTTTNIRTHVFRSLPHLPTHMCLFLNFR